jgi:hypothetical protein
VKEKKNHVDLPPIADPAATDATTNCSSPKRPWKPPVVELVGAEKTNSAFAGDGVDFGFYS